MYRAEQLSGSDGDLKQGTFHGLAEAIRVGCLFRPRKVKRSFLSKTDGADVFGALSVGFGWDKCSRRKIIERFPLLAQMVMHPHLHVETGLSCVLLSLNDYFEWPREDIADWLCQSSGCKHEITGGDVAALHGAFLKHVAPVVKPKQIKPISQRSYHRIAQGIRRGCLLRPVKIKGELKSGRRGACALGALAESAGFREVDFPMDELMKKFRALEAEIINPLTGEEGGLSDAISTLNDETDYSREQIADWLCECGGCKHQIRESGIRAARTKERVLEAWFTGPCEDADPNYDEAA
jgi:hypothetical protein